MSGSWRRWENDSRGLVGHRQWSLFTVSVSFLACLLGWPSLGGQLGFGGAVFASAGTRVVADVGYFGRRQKFEFAEIDFGALNSNGMECGGATVGVLAILRIDRRHAFGR